MRLIVDADPLVYGMGFAADGEPAHHALNLVKMQLNKYMERFGTDDISVHLTGSRDAQWRPLLYPDYKASRLNAPKPEHYKAIREYLIRHWNAKVSEGIEADDAVCLEAYKYKGYSLYDPDPSKEELDQMAPQCVMISVDKDLDQCPGWRFKPGTDNRPKDWFYYVDVDTAALWWGCQMLMGDDGDDIKGIPGIGPAKAKKMLLALESEAPPGLMYNDILVHVHKIYRATGLSLEDMEKTDTLVSMIQEDFGYADMRKRATEAADSKSGVAGQEIQVPSV